MDVSRLAESADLISLSGHKVYGPQGIGALYIRRDLQPAIEPVIYGGGQQNGLRSGTVPVPLCAGMAAAVEIVLAEGLDERRKVAELRNLFVSLLQNSRSSVSINGASWEWRHPGNANLRFDSFDAQDILGAVQPGLAASTAATVLGSSADLDPAVVRQFFRIIDEQADHMHDLVADLLDVARIETGTLPVTPEPAEVAVLVDRARSAFTSAGGRNNLAIDIPPDLPLVMADRRRVVQVVGNLLSNAAKHSSESSVITVTVVREDVHVAVSVADEGRGIPSERLPYLFRKFTRTDGDDLGSGVAGSGLGLAICKGIVEAHGGRIWAESEGPGMGARFTFTIPTVEEAGSGAASGPSPLSTRSSRRAMAGAGERVRVLAVDDDPQALRYVRDALASAGYTPVVTGDPGEALRLVEEEKPDLVLLDLMLPGTDGIELMKDILWAADVPVIFVSAYGRDELIARAFDMGAVDYVV